MAAAYAAYATQALNALETLLETTGVKMGSAVDFVSCGAGLQEHFLPKTSLKTHLQKCHGGRRPLVINNAAFYYNRPHGRNLAISQEQEPSESVLKSDVKGRKQHGSNAKLRSVVELEVDGQKVSVEHQGVIPAIRRTSGSIEALYQQVQAWQRIPRPFAIMHDTERQLVANVSLWRWLHAELNRPGVCVSDQLDNELVEYVVGLLDHPDFRQPDLLVQELHEFLGNNVADIVLALWKFMIVEIGLHSVFKMAKALQRTEVQVSSAATDRVPATALTSVQPQSSDTIRECEYKRRRTSYRKKVGTKTGLAAYREMIEKHMIGLSQEMGRELVLGGGFCEEKKGSKEGSNSQPYGLQGKEWWNSTDALEVRNRSRRQGESNTSTKQRQEARSDRHFGAKPRQLSDTTLNKRNRPHRSRSRETRPRRLTCHDSRLDPRRHITQSRSIDRDRCRNQFRRTRRQ